jgi:hypothetical protein
MFIFFLLFASLLFSMSPILSLFLCLFFLFAVSLILHYYCKKVHCKKEFAVFPSPAGMSLIKLFLSGNNLVFFRPERVRLVTSRLRPGKWLTLFYSVDTFPLLFCACLSTLFKKTRIKFVCSLNLPTNTTKSQM